MRFQVWDASATATDEGVLCEFSINKGSYATAVLREIMKVDVVQMVLCPDCGKDVPKAKFCKNCGAYIANVKEERNEQFVDAHSEESKQALVPTQQPKKVKFCFNCGNEIDANFKFCPECGQDLSGNVVKASVSSSNDKNILIAIILSVFLPG